MARRGGRVPQDELRQMDVGLPVESVLNADGRVAELRFLRDLTERRWKDYLRPPAKCDADFWASIVSRFGVTDLVTPALNAIVGAAMGGQIIRTVDGAIDVDAVRKFVASPDWDRQWRGFCRDVVLYGTAYMEIGWNRKGKPRLTLLPPCDTEIITAADDVEDVVEVRVRFGKTIKSFRESGVYVRQEDGDDANWVRLAPVTGYLPVVIGRSPHRSSTSPYGQPLVRAAADESKQATSLSNDVTVLARTQSYSTLVLQGGVMDSGDKQVSGPWAYLRLNSDDPNAKAYYITPDARIGEIDMVIDRKYERAAAQCSVPVEVFRQPKSGTNQGSGAALLTHKPLFDLACTLQKIMRASELQGMSMVDAMAMPRAEDATVDLDTVAESLVAEVVFEMTMNPSVTQDEVQAWKMAVDESFVDFDRARAHFTANDTEEASVEAGARRADAADKKAAMAVPFM